MSMFEESDNGLRTATVDEMREVLASVSMPLDAKKQADDELEVLSRMSDRSSAEYRLRAGYVSYLISLPWNRITGDTIDLARLKSTLDQRIPSRPEAGQVIYAHIERILSRIGSIPTILVVDDEKIALSSIERALRKEGYTVVAASSGAEAVEQLNACHFDVVITDLIMGEVDGYAVLVETRKKYPDTRLIMITGYATVDTAVQALRMGAFHYIENHLKLDEVRETV
ncbi:MAG: response regulator, partial [Nitrospiraceae bacterium]